MLRSVGGWGRSEMAASGLGEEQAEQILAKGNGKLRDWLRYV